MQHFAPVSAFFGELLISLDAVVLMLFPSRIAGIAAIVGGLLGFDCREIVWRVAFVLGLISSPLSVGLAQGARFRSSRSTPCGRWWSLAAFSAALARGSAAVYQRPWRLRAGAAVGPRRDARVVLPSADGVPRSQCGSRCIALEHY